MEKNKTKSHLKCVRDYLYKKLDKLHLRYEYNQHYHATIVYVSLGEELGCCFTITDALLKQIKKDYDKLDFLLNAELKIAYERIKMEILKRHYASAKDDETDKSRKIIYDPDCPVEYDILIRHPIKSIKSDNKIEEKL